MSKMRLNKLPLSSRMSGSINGTTVFGMTTVTVNASMDMKPSPPISQGRSAVLLFTKYAPTPQTAPHIVE